MNTELIPRPGSHIVQFYEREQELVSRVTLYLERGLQLGQAAVVIATPEHLEMFFEQLHQDGINVSEATQSGALVTLDAAATLATFMRDGAPDASGFDLVIGGLIRQLTGKGTPACAYGEMVALLWDEGNVQGALELERLWNAMLGTAPFSLLCAYPKSVVGKDQMDPLSDVCRLHSEVVSPVLGSTNMADVLITHTFQPVNQSAAAARRFVAETLEHSGYGHLIDDAMVVVSELATNAAVHTRKPFVVSIDFDRGAVRLAVQDGSRTLPKCSDNVLSDLGGRGLILVEALTARWGAELNQGGKVVWAEFDDD